MGLPAARVRIGRVRFKDGGPILAVVPRPRTSKVGVHMRECFTAWLRCPDPPDAYAAVAFWVEDGYPGHPRYEATYCTNHHEITPHQACEMAALCIREEPTKVAAVSRTLEHLGHEMDWWDPDPDDVA